MRIKNIVGKLVFGELSADLASFGQRVEQQIEKDLELQPIVGFEALRDLKDLRGDSTGYVKAFSADKLEKMAFLSIDIMPGMRYFNIHIIPDHHYKLPRFNLEGMVSTKGSQVSTDLYPDLDIVLDFAFIRDNYAGVAQIYEKAKKAAEFRPEPSRLPHMRALCSPYFLLGNGMTPEALAKMEEYSLGYFAQWLKMYHRAEYLDEEHAVAQLHRRQLIARTIIENDPDRDKVVNTYGEEMTCRIEQAAML
jgi:Ferredoxin-dependent bilin reductase